MQKLLDKCSHQIVHKLQKTKHQTNKSTGNCMKIYENSYVSKNYVHLFLFFTYPNPRVFVPRVLFSNDTYRPLPEAR